MENFKKNVHDLTHRVATGDHSHPAADIDNIKRNVEHFNSGTAVHPVMPQIRKKEP